MKRFKEGTVIITVITCLVILTGCGGLSKMAKNAKNVQWDVTPEKLELRDDSLEVEITVTFPSKYFYKLALIELTPVLEYKDGETEFASKTVQGEAVQGNCEICSFANGGTFKTKSKIPFEYAMRNYKLVGRIKASMKGKEYIVPDQELTSGQIYVKNLNEGDNNFNVSKPQVERRTKEKIVEYQKNGYAVKYISKKKMMVSNQPISIYSIPEGEMIVDGVTKDVNPWIDVYGVWANKYGRIKGTFRVKNSESNIFTLIPKKAADLSVNVLDINYYVPHYYKTPITIAKSESIAPTIQSGMTYLLTLDDAKHSKSKIEIPLNKDRVMKSYSDIDKLLLSAERAKITTTEYSFVGQVEPKKNGIFVDYIQKVGKRTYKAGPYKEVTIEKAGANYNIKLICNDSGIKNETLSLSSDDFSKIEWWNIDEYLKNTKNIDIQYANGNSFNGTFEVNNGRVKPQIGVYRYVNGDVFKGDVSGKTTGGAFIEGTTTFADKSTANGNWLDKYQLTLSQLFEIEKESTPTAKRKLAEEKQKENVYYSYVKNGDNAFQSQKYEDAKRWYEYAQNARPDYIGEDKKLNERLNYIKETVEKEQKRKRLIAKYGQAKGTKLANGILEIGMTKQMAEEIVDHSIYRVSKSRDYKGNSIEVWEYDPNKILPAFNNATNELIDGSSSGEEVLAIALLQAFGGAFEGDLKRHMRNKVNYKYIKFRNNTVVEIRDHSDYEDIDDSYNDIMNSLMWDF
ncbi:MAG: hypothetical protein IKZ99_10550 [Salinivirgaceae bacterium]|nr:hypothetical protein [Salinivirgaceae bacterium]